MRIGIPLLAADDYIETIGENEINCEANQIATDNASIYQPEPEGEIEYYPDLEIDFDGEAAPMCSVNGMPVQSTELIGGMHQPQRPK